MLYPTFCMRYITLVPAYGRDYTSAKAVIADWRAGKDFEDVLSGSYVNRDDIGPHTTINLRYKKLTMVAVVRPVKSK
jgi:hypothetical protein